jgi:two-component system NtrC family sensor kinase
VDENLAMPETTALQSLINWLGIDPINIYKEPSALNVPDVNLPNSIAAKYKLRMIESLAQAALDNVSPRIAALDMNGEIIMVNHAWRTEAYLNGSVVGNNMCEGINYLNVCDRVRGKDATFSRSMSKAIRGVIQDESASYSISYPCHAPHEKRWFTARVTSFSKLERRCIVLYHEAISEADFTKLQQN